MNYNKRPISLREGKVFVNGIAIYDDVACTITFTPEVWTGKQLRDKTSSSVWLGVTITGSITRRRVTPWLKEIIQEYLRTGVTPEFTIQGVQNDRNSDYFREHGSETVTAVGVVLTGDLNLLQLDGAGDVLNDVISFNAHSLT